MLKNVFCVMVVAPRSVVQTKHFRARFILCAERERIRFRVAVLLKKVFCAMIVAPLWHFRAVVFSLLRMAIFSLDSGVFFWITYPRVCKGEGRGEEGNLT
ncbi:MAG: hypothetical protein LBL80_06090 [Ruminococcus sp.]|nr:hypothetical protein [Ruminococcus sp.]